MQNKVILQAVQLLDLCGTLRRYRLRRIQCDLRRHISPVIRCRVRKKAPCFKFVINECALAAMRTNARKSLYFLSAFVANHIVSSLLSKFYFIS